MTRFLLCISIILTCCIGKNTQLIQLSEKEKSDILEKHNTDDMIFKVTNKYHEILSDSTLLTIFSRAPDEFFENSKYQSKHFDSVDFLLTDSKLIIFNYKFIHGNCEFISHYSEYNDTIEIKTAEVKYAEIEITENKDTVIRISECETVTFYLIETHYILPNDIDQKTILFKNKVLKE